MLVGSAPAGLYSWIQSNDGRSTGLFLAFLAAIQAIAPLALVGPLLFLDVEHAPFFDWGGYLLRYAPLVLVASIVWFAAQLWWHVESVKKAVGFHFVDAEDEPRLCQVIEPLIILTGLPVPFLGVIDSDARNAFACGVGRKKAVVVVTRGLIDALDDHELAAVLAHELSHIRHNDIRLMAAANIFMSALYRLHARNALRFTWVHGLLALAVPAVLPLSLAGSLLGRLALRGGQVSRLLIASSREFIADAESAGWTQNPGALASALLKVDGRHRIANARNEDDAMMIAGDSVGTHATHPTIAHRVAALARVTGSMVFNAPSAPRDGDWTDATSRHDVERMTFDRRRLAVQAIARVRQGDNENFFGLTIYGTVALVATIGALIGLHEADLTNPRAMAAKFDIRPIGLMIGAPISCQMAHVLPSFYRRCDMGTDSSAYRDFEGQTNTLSGWLADASRRRADRGIRNADLNILSLGREQTPKPYYGDSGRLRGVTALHPGGSDEYYVDGDSFGRDPPIAAVIAEVDQVGCIPGKDRVPFMNGPPLSLGEEKAGWSIARLDEEAEEAALQATVSAPTRSTAVSYLNRRELLVRFAYDIYGQPGLAQVQQALATPMHVEVLRRLPTMTMTADTGKVTPLEEAELRALMRAPVGFVPCRSLQLSNKTLAR